MTYAWTETLAPNLARALRGGRWQRVERGRDGAWYVLGGNEGAGPHEWWRLDAGDPEAELSAVPLCDDPELPQLATLISNWLDGGDTVRLLAHRLGSRAAFLVARCDERFVAKVYRRDRAALVRWRHFAGLRAPWRVPRVLAWDDETRALHIEHHALASLHEKWMNGRGERSDGARIADLLDALARTPVVPELPVHGAREETELLFDALEDFEQALAAPPPEAVALVARVVSLVDHDPAKERRVSGHRDLHDKQLLLSGAGGVLIDLDLAAAVPAALDPGNLLAHLRLRAFQGARMRWQEIAAEIARPLLAAGLRDSLHRWTAAALLRLALIYARRAHPEHLVDRLLESAVEACDRGGDWKDLV